MINVFYIYIYIFISAFFHLTAVKSKTSIAGRTHIGMFIMALNAVGKSKDKNGNNGYSKCYFSIENINLDEQKQSEHKIWKNQLIKEHCTHVQ